MLVAGEAIVIALRCVPNSPRLHETAVKEVMRIRIRRIEHYRLSQRALRGGIILPLIRNDSKEPLRIVIFRIVLRHILIAAGGRIQISGAMMFQRLLQELTGRQPRHVTLRPERVRCFRSLYWRIPRCITNFKKRALAFRPSAFNLRHDVIRKPLCTFRRHAYRP